VVVPGEALEAQNRNKWWEAPYKGGNVRGDHSQAFVEMAPELFLMQTILLEKEKPGLLRSATETWLRKNHSDQPSEAAIPEGVPGSS